MHLAFGKSDFSVDDLMENLNAIVQSVNANKPPGAKGIYWKNCYLSTTMGPSIKLDLEQLVTKE